jgi:ABC-type maltose transport system permease subunit
MPPRLQAPFLMAIPVLILLIFVGQKYFVNGLTAGSVKG